MRGSRKKIALRNTTLEEYDLNEEDKKSVQEFNDRVGWGLAEQYANVLTRLGAYQGQSEKVEDVFFQQDAQDLYEIEKWATARMGDSAAQRFLRLTREFKDKVMTRSAAPKPQDIRLPGARTQPIQAKNPTLTPEKLKEGLKIRSKANPEWGVWTIQRKYDDGIWEMRSEDRRNETTLFEGEADFWDIVEESETASRRADRKQRMLEKQMREQTPRVETDTNIGVRWISPLDVQAFPKHGMSIPAYRSAEGDDKDYISMEDFDHQTFIRKNASMSLPTAPKPQDIRLGSSFFKDSSSRRADLITFADIEAAAESYAPIAVESIRGRKYEAGTVNSRGWRSPKAHVTLAIKTAAGPVTIKAPLNMTISAKSGNIHLSNSAITGTIDWNEAKITPKEARKALISSRPHLRGLIKAYLRPYQASPEKIFPGIQHVISTRSKVRAKQTQITVRRPDYVPREMTHIWRAAARVALSKGELLRGKGPARVVRNRAAVKREYRTLLASYHRIAGGAS